MIWFCLLYDPKLNYLPQIVALFAVAIGSVCSMVFHVGVNENVSNSDEKFEDCTITDVNKKKVIVQCGLYHIMAVYTMSQLFVNQSQVFIPLYLEEYLHIEAQRLPVLPLIMYISSSLTSYATKNLNINYGRKVRKCVTLWR